MNFQDELDSALILRLQQGLPLVWEPYAAIGAEFGIPANQVLERLARYRSEGIVRRLGAVFNVTQLGYQSALCGIAVPAAELDDVASILKPHPGITHAYSRSCKADHNLDPLIGSDGITMPNLWFTLSTLAEHFTRDIDALQALIPYPIRVAPATRKFKVQVILDPNQLHTQKNSVEHESEVPVIGTEFVESTLEERKLIAALHQDLPDCEQPFASIASTYGFTPEVFLDRLRTWHSKGALRRIGVLARHQKLGFSANAMCTWNVPTAQIETAGIALASRREVTHCYERKTFPGFPYNTFAMIHAGTEASLKELANSLSTQIGTPLGQFFVSIREYKKSSLIPFWNEYP